MEPSPFRATSSGYRRRPIGAVSGPLFAAWRRCAL